jgi:hypothetical protein
MTNFFSSQPNKQWIAPSKLSTTTSSGGGSGDVVGPASSTNNSVAIFDGTTGKLLKETTVLPITSGGTGVAAFGASYVPFMNTGNTALTSSVLFKNILTGETFASENGYTNSYLYLGSDGDAGVEGDSAISGTIAFFNTSYSDADQTVAKVSGVLSGSGDGSGGLKIQFRTVGGGYAENIFMSAAGLGINEEASVAFQVAGASILRHNTSTKIPLTVRTLDNSSTNPLISIRSSSNTELARITALGSFHAPSYQVWGGGSVGLYSDTGTTLRATITSSATNKVSLGGSVGPAVLDYGGLTSSREFDFPDEAGELKLASTKNGTISRTSDRITSVAITGGKTYTVSRDVNNFISSIADGVRTWTFTRNVDNRITSWAVA